MVLLFEYFSCYFQGDISNLRMPCIVGGMNMPLFLALKCNTRGLSVAYKTPSPDTDEEM